MGINCNILGNVVSKGLGLPAGYAFDFGNQEIIDIPTNSADNWIVRRNVGGASISVVDIDTGEIKKIGSSKAIRMNTGVNVYSSNGAVLDLGASYNMLNYDLCVWIRMVDGEGVSAFEGNVGLKFKYYTNYTGDVQNYQIASPAIEYYSPGWYAFSLTPSFITDTSSGLPLPTDVKRIEFNITKQDTSFDPIIEIGRVVLVPKKPKAQICFMCDGGYPSHLTVADKLTEYGMNGTFYVNSVESPNLTAVQLRAMQSNGHLIAAYCASFGDDPLNVPFTLAKLTSVQSLFRANGLYGGRHMVHGGTGVMTEDLWNAFVPKYADTIGFGMNSLQSKYHKTYMSRYHEFTAATKATIINVVNNAVTDQTKLGILVHDMVGTDLTAIIDFIENTLAPLQVSGDIEVVNVKQVFDS